MTSEALPILFLGNKKKTPRKFYLNFTASKALAKAGGPAQFGYLPRMALANIGAMNAESFCERKLSCASLIVTDLHTSLSREEVRTLTDNDTNECLSYGIHVSRV